MRSINGFNNSSLQGSSDSFLINKIGAGVDIAKTAMSNDVQFQSSNGGTSYSLPSPVYIGESFKQFDCVVQKWKDPANPSAAPEYRLRCVRGLTSFENYNVDDRGFVKDEQFVYNKRIRKWNAYPTGTFEYDPDDASEVFLDDGYIKLTKNKNYKVFIWKLNPTVDYWPESQSTQIAVIEEGIAADTNVMPKYNGGGSMQAYIVSESNTVDNVVVADTIGRIAGLDVAELNPLVTFHVEELLVTDNNDANYPEALSTELAGAVPTLLNKSTNPYTCLSYDGDSISGVPFGINWKLGTASGGGYVTILTSAENLTAQYANEGDELNCSADDVIIGRDISSYFTPPIVVNNLITGLILPEDAFRVRIADYTPSQPPIIEFDGGIEIKADNVTSITSSTVEMVSGKPVGNVGFKEFDCARKEIAYIKWVADDPEHPELTGKFDIYQINNGPINFNYKPIMLDFIKVQTQADAHWGILNDAWVSPQIVEIGLYWEGSGAYEDDLSSNKYKENSNNIGGFLPGSPTRSSG